MKWDYYYQVTFDESSIFEEAEAKFGLNLQTNYHNQAKLDQIIYAQRNLAFMYEKNQI